LVPHVEDVAVLETDEAPGFVGDASSDAPDAGIAPNEPHSTLPPTADSVRTASGTVTLNAAASSLPAILTDSQDGLYLPLDALEPDPPLVSALDASAPEFVTQPNPVLEESADAPEPVPAASTPSVASSGLEAPSSDEGFLEEEVIAPASTGVTGETLSLERGAYTVTGFDESGRRLAVAPDGAEVVIAAYPGGAAVTRSLYPHPMLPALLDAATEESRTLIAHPRLQGRTLEAALQSHDRAAAVGAVLDLARFNRYLAARGFALTGLEPREVLLEPTRLARLPNVRKIGDDAPAEAPRYGAPERSAGAAITGTEGVYTLGAMLYHALEGRALGEGEVPSHYPQVPGVPQALSAMLAPASQRATPQDALELVVKLSDALQPRRAWTAGSSSTVGVSPDRQTNEDACGVLLRDTNGSSGNEFGVRACVADGMGGMARGEDASQAAVRGFLAFESVEFTKAVAAQAAQAANARVIEALEGKSGGCTFTGALCDGERVLIAHVGDTRAYLVSDMVVQQLTEDHSMVMMLVKMNVIPLEAAHNHPDSNKVMRALGSNRVMPPDYVDTLEITARPGNRLVLMSDGVWGPLTPTDLEALLLQDLPPQAMSDALVRAALHAGSTDNATAVVLQLEEREAL
jgi:protein phosphatase